MKIMTNFNDISPPIFKLLIKPSDTVEARTRITRVEFPDNAN